MKREIGDSNEGKEKLYITYRGFEPPIFMQSHGSAERRDTAIDCTDVAKTMFPTRNQFLVGRSNESMMVDAVSVSQTID